jgi:hypothetical protein
LELELEPGRMTSDYENKPLRPLAGLSPNFAQYRMVETSRWFLTPPWWRANGAGSYSSTWPRTLPASINFMALRCPCWPPTVWRRKNITIEVVANWKVVVKVSSETHHAHATHPQIKPYVKDCDVQTEFYPNGYNRALLPVTSISSCWPDDVSMNEGLAYLMQEAGINPAS